jgi:hypothetical protein
VRARGSKIPPGPINFYNGSSYSGAWKSVRVRGAKIPPGPINLYNGSSYSGAYNFEIAHYTIFLENLCPLVLISFPFQK